MTSKQLNPNTADVSSLSKVRWQAAGTLLLGLGMTLSLAAQTTDEHVAPSPKGPNDTGIITPESVAPVKVEDARQAEAAPVTAAPPVVSAEEARLNAVLITALKGLAFTSSAEQSKEQGEVSGVVATTELPLLSTPAFKEKVAARYLGKPVTLASINALNRDVVAFYKDNGLPVVDVIVPEQDITAGTLRMIVLQARLGEVKVKGNKYFSDKVLTAQIRTAPGALLTSKKILDDLNWLNQNPFRRVGLVYARGEEVGTTDLVLQVEDRRPLRFYVGYDDSGNDATGNNRYSAGVNWGNAFGLDHQLNYQFTTTDDLDTFYAHSASYVVPLPWRHTLTTYATYANSTAEVIAGTLNADGESYSTGVRYAVPLPSTPKLTHQLFFGYDYKFSSNSLILLPSSHAPANKTEVSQFNIGYAANLRDSFGATTLTATGFYSPGDMTPHNHTADFSKANAGAADYSYGNLTIERVTLLPADFSLVAKITGQLSSDNLLVSEQLGAGGYATVRGYDERVANAEEGILASVELHTPSIHVFGNDQLQFLGFWDGAQLYRHEDDPTLGATNSYSLSSAGVGLRYAFSTYMSVRLDYGWQMKDSAVGSFGDSRGHVGVVLSY